MDEMLILFHSNSSSSFSMMSWWSSTSITVYRIWHLKFLIPAHSLEPEILCSMSISWNLYLPLISCNFHKWLVLQGPISKTNLSKETCRRYASAYFPTEILLDFFNILLQYVFSLCCCPIHISRGFCSALNVVIFAKYNSSIHFSKADACFNSSHHSHLWKTHLLK